MDLGEIRRYLNRTEWGEFPDVFICANEPTATRHRLYAAAKIGDAKAADGLVVDVLANLRREALEGLIGAEQPKLLG